jgi:DNA-binding NarL/FixJ family response regulator
VHLSNRETEIIRLICKGFINKEMASQLDLSIRTVERYRENIYEKTSTRSAVEIAIYAIKHRIVNLGEV